jgi:hypothetical protein
MICYEFQHEQRAVVTCSDKGKKTKYIYENQSRDFLSKYKVDGCLIVDDNARCDYLLLNCNKNQSYFIEIKGSDIIRAIEQIDRSIDLLKEKLTDFSVFARIVLTRINTIDLRDAKYLRLEKKIKNMNGDLLYKSRELKEVN